MPDGMLHWFVGPKLIERDEQPVVEAALGVATAALEAAREAPGGHYAAFAKPHKSIVKAMRRLWRDQQKAMLQNTQTLFDAAESKWRHAEAASPAVTAALAVSISNIEQESLAQIFDEALTAALEYSAAQVAEQVGAITDQAYSTFEASYLADHGFQKLTGGIDQTTIQRVADEVAKAYESGANYQGIVKAIKGVFADFSDKRADLIAQTELENAYRAGVLEFGKEAGAAFKSSHTTSDNPCPACIENEEAGQIPIAEDWPNDWHPRCQCDFQVHSA